MLKVICGELTNNAKLMLDDVDIMDKLCVTFMQATYYPGELATLSMTCCTEGSDLSFLPEGTTVLIEDRIKPIRQTAPPIYPSRLRLSRKRL